jgi:hypothetical protein
VKPTIFLAMLACMVGGCATTQPKEVVSVEAFASAEAPAFKTYLLFPSVFADKPERAESDLQYQEFSRYVHAVLAARGFVSATKPDTPDLLIYFNYGVSDPDTKQFSVARPVFGQTGVASANTQGQVTAIGNMATLNATTTYTPTYGVTGYRSEMRSITTYYRSASLVAYDVREMLSRDAATLKDPMKEIWKVGAADSGSNSNIRAAMPFLAAAMETAIGTNTPGPIQRALALTDSEAMRLMALGHPEALVNTKK